MVVMGDFKFKPGDRLRDKDSHDWHRVVKELVTAEEGDRYTTDAFIESQENSISVGTRLPKKWVEERYELVPQPPRFKEGDLIRYERTDGTYSYWLVGDRPPVNGCPWATYTDEYGSPTKGFLYHHRTEADFEKVEPKKRKVPVELVGPTGNVETTVELEEPLPSYYYVPLRAVATAIALGVDGPTRAYYQIDHWDKRAYFKGVE